MKTTGSFANVNLSLFLILLSCSLFCACSGPEGEVASVLDKRTEAFEKMDLDYYMSFVSSDYADGPQTYDSLKNRMEKLFDGLEKIEFEVEKREISISAKRDHAFAKQLCRVQFTLANGTVKSGVGEERLYLKLEKGQWKVVSGLIHGIPKKSSNFGLITPSPEYDFSISSRGGEKFFTLN